MSQSNEDIQFLIDLQKELQYQSEYDNDIQAAPRFWAVGDYEWRVVAEGCGEEVRFRLPQRDDYEATYNSLVDEIKEQIENIEFAPEAVEAFEDVHDDESLLDWIKEYYDEEADMYEVTKTHIVRQDTLFITKQEAKDHIKANHYHYTDEVHTYAMTAWRAPQVERLWKILENFDWSKVEIKEADEKVNVHN